MLASTTRTSRGHGSLSHQEINPSAWLRYARDVEAKGLKSGITRTHVGPSYHQGPAINIRVTIRIALFQT